MLYVVQHISCSTFFVFVLSCRKIFDEDNYSPICCDNESEYTDILKEFPFESSEKPQVCMF